MSAVTVTNLGLTDFREAWKIQQRVFSAREQGRVGDMLLLTEHPHVYTLGKSGDANHLLATPDELSIQGIDVCAIDRGGDITYHGPGQLVGYPILNLHGFYLDLHRYLRDLEEVLIRSIGRFGIEGVRDPAFTGVWVGNEKIAAIGVKTARWITMHGFALNVSADLSHFDKIIPCGIFHKGVTSMEKVLGRLVSMEDVRVIVKEEFARVFMVDTVKRSRKEIMDELNMSDARNIVESMECTR